MKRCAFCTGFIARLRGAVGGVAVGRISMPTNAQDCTKAVRSEVGMPRPRSPAQLPSLQIHGLRLTLFVQVRGEGDLPGVSWLGTMMRHASTRQPKPHDNRSGWPSDRAGTRRSGCDASRPCSRYSPYRHRKHHGMQVLN